MTSTNTTPEPDAERDVCTDGKCQHEKTTRTITVHFESCDHLWDEAEAMRRGITDLPDEITIKGNSPIGILPMMLVHAGVIHLGKPKPE